MTDEHPCEHETAGTLCGHPTRRRYLTGWKCATHTPAALADRPETTPDPARTLNGLRAAAGLPTDRSYTPTGETIIDARAKASGKRRSSTQDYRTAQHQTGARP